MTTYILNHEINFVSTVMIYEILIKRFNYVTYLTDRIILVMMKENLVRRFRIAAVYSNQDNKMGRSSAKFYLQRGGFQSPRAPVLEKAVALSPHSIQINWTVSYLCFTIKK